MKSLFFRRCAISTTDLLTTLCLPRALESLMFVESIVRQEGHSYIVDAADSAQLLAALQQQSHSLRYLCCSFILYSAPQTTSLQQSHQSSDFQALHTLEVTSRFIANCLLMHGFRAPNLQQLTLVDSYGYRQRTWRWREISS